MLQVRLTQTLVTSVAEAISSHPLRGRSLDSRPHAVARASFHCLHKLSHLQERLVLFLRIQA